MPWAYDHYVRFQEMRRKQLFLRWLGEKKELQKCIEGQNQQQKTYQQERHIVFKKPELAKITTGFFGHCRHVHQENMQKIFEMQKKQRVTAKEALDIALEIQRLKVLREQTMDAHQKKKRRLLDNSYHVHAPTKALMQNFFPQR